MSPFEIVYGFNPLTALDLLPLPLNAKESIDGAKRAEMIKTLHEKVRTQIEEKNKQYATKANKGRKEIIFQPGDWVWVHMRKERFPEKRKSKLLPRGDGPFQVLERINNNAYKIDLPGEYTVSATFNVSDLTPFDVGSDSRKNLFEEGGNDAKASKEHSSMPTGPITRSKSKKLQQAFSGLVKDVLGPNSSLIIQDQPNCLVKNYFEVQFDDPDILA